MDFDQIFSRTNDEEMKNGIPCKIENSTFYLTFYNSSRAQLRLNAEVGRLKTENSILEKDKQIDNTDMLVKAMRIVLVEEIIKGWTNVRIDKKDLPYSKENATWLLDEFQGLDVMLTDLATKIGNYKKSQIDEDKKKSIQSQKSLTNSQVMKKSKSN